MRRMGHCGQDICPSHRTTTHIIVRISLWSLRPGARAPGFGRKVGARAPGSGRKVERAPRTLGERGERALRALGETWSARTGLWEKRGSARSGLWEKSGARATDCRGAQSLWVNWSIAGVCENQHIHADVFCTECQWAAAFTARSGWGNRGIALAIALTRSPPPGHRPWPGCSRMALLVCCGRPRQDIDPPGRWHMAAHKKKDVAQALGKTCQPGQRP